MTESPNRPHLTFGMSPCPNDTFAFHALVHDTADADITVSATLDDIETLNRRAHTGDLDLTKLSMGALAKSLDRYMPLRSGAALGRGVGPLLVTRRDIALDDALSADVAIPGRDTTAFLLLQRVATDLGIELADVRERRYDQIVDDVATGRATCGLIIHESRFTYADHGLQRVLDLGEWWESRTGLPTPLAVICARRDLPYHVQRAAERSLHASVQYAFEHPDESRAWIRASAQELSDEVCRQHIDLYVNDYTLALDDTACRAVNELIGRDAFAASGR